MKYKYSLAVVFFISAFIAMGQSDRFAGRPSSAGPDVASSKDNVPVKKETFVAKLDRYKKEGFKVAVVFVSDEIVTMKPSATATSSEMQQIALQGSLPSQKDALAPLADKFTARMNSEFGTDIFEQVDMSLIPYKEAKFGKVDDWGSTKYKMVLTFSATPWFDYSKFGSKFSGKMVANLNVIGTEFVNDPKKGVKMKYPIRSGNLGAYSTDIMNWDSDPGYADIKQLRDTIKPPLGSDLLPLLQAEYDKKIDEFIAKRKSK